jgi:hypothetical protein
MIFQATKNNTWKHRVLPLGSEAEIGLVRLKRALSTK